MDSKYVCAILRRENNQSKALIKVMQGDQELYKDLCKYVESKRMLSLYVCFLYVFIFADIIKSP